MKLLKTIKRKLKDEAGQALPMALIMMLLGGLLVVPTLSFTSTNLRTNMAVDQANLRLYAADAGIQYAYNRFLSGLNPADPDFLPASLPDPVNGCEVTLARAFVDDLWEITSNATDPVTGKSTEIVAHFLANAAQYEAGSSPFDYAVATLGGDLTVTGSSKITSVPAPPPYNGDVWVNGNIVLDSSAIIEGDAATTGTCNRPGNIRGTYEPGSDPMERPLWLDTQVQDYVDSTNAAAPVCSGTTYSGWTPNPGTYGASQVNGAMTIKGNGTYTFTGPICVTGILSIQRGANFVTFQGPVKVGGYAEFIGNGTVQFVNPAPAQTIAYGYHAIGVAQGSSVNMSSYSATAILQAGTFGSGGSADVKLQDSNDGTTWTDVPGGDFATVTELNDNNTYKNNYNGTKPYLRAMATVSGANCQFGVSIIQKNTTLHVGKYLEVNNSRSARFEGPVVVSGAALKSSQYIVYCDGSKYSGVAWDVVFNSTLRATEPTPNCNHSIYFGSGRQYEFYDVVYTNVSATLAGNGSSNMAVTKALIADCNINVTNSSKVNAPPETSPIFCARHGYINVLGDARVDAIVYAPEGNVHVDGSSELEGAIVAKSALLEGNIKLKYPVVLRERDDVHPPEQGEPSPGETLYSIVSYSIQ